MAPTQKGHEQAIPFLVQATAYVSRAYYDLFVWDSMGNQRLTVLNNIFGVIFALISILFLAIVIATLLNPSDNIEDDLAISLLKEVTRMLYFCNWRPRQW